MTDLQAHVEAPGRADLVKQVSEKIKETGVDYIYYQFISVTGRIMGKGIHAAHWERLAEKGFQLVYARPRTCLSTATGITSATVPSLRNWLVSPIPKPSVNYPGTSA